jgi:hypothetical protein
MGPIVTYLKSWRRVAAGIIALSLLALASITVRPSTVMVGR